jgi:hypothetical protein
MGRRGEEDVAGLVRRAADDLGVGPPPTAAIVRRGVARRHRVRIRTATGAAVAVAALPVLGVGAVRLVRTEAEPRPAATITVSPPAPTPTGCSARVPSRVLPPWARTGFSDPEPSQPFVLGDRGDIIAILFAQPLQAPPAADHNNKILWVPRVWTESGPLVIDATLVGTAVTARREIDGGPGPSIIDLPQAGCWQLHLRWGKLEDNLRLRYEL